jgi:hypothetical protein
MNHVDENINNKHANILYQYAKGNQYQEIKIDFNNIKKKYKTRLVIKKN